MIYSVTMTVSKPCGVIGCSCSTTSTKTRYVSCSYMPSKAEILKWEPGLEHATVEKKDDKGNTLSIKRFKRLHANINGRKVDCFSNWYGVIR